MSGAGVQPVWCPVPDGAGTSSLAADENWAQLQGTGADRPAKAGVKRPYEDCVLQSSCSQDSSAFAFDPLPSLPASATSPTVLLPCGENDETFSEECTGRLHDDGAESMSTPQPATAPLGADSQDPLFAPEVMEMLRLALDREAELTLQPNYLRNHDESVQAEHYINAEMRKLTVGWMGEVVREFGLCQETLFLACGLFDRFLSCSKAVPRICLQLVAVACVQIAAKNEEVVYPSVRSFTYIAGNAFSGADLVRTESLVLRCLSWRIQLPTAYAFLSIYKHALDMGPKTVALACYLLELSQLEYSMLAYRPSQMAAAASMLAMLYFNQQADFRSLANASCSSLVELKGCIELMLALQKSALLAQPASPSAVVQEEYRTAKWLGAACVTPFECLPLSVCAPPLVVKF